MVYQKFISRVDVNKVKSFCKFRGREEVVMLKSTRKPWGFAKYDLKTTGGVTLLFGKA